MQNNTGHMQYQNNTSTNIVIDNDDILKSKIGFFINNVQDGEIRMIDIINYIEGVQINNIIREIIEHNIFNITENGEIVLRNHYDSDFMKDIGGLISFNYILSTYAKKNMISSRLKKFIMKVFSHCLGLIAVSLDSSENSDQYGKLLLYCIKLTKRIMEFTDDEIIKTTTICDQLEQNITTIKNDQKILLGEITRYATIVSIQNDEIMKVNEKIESLNNDIIMESKKEPVKKVNKDPQVGKIMDADHDDNNHSESVESSKSITNKTPPGKIVADKTPHEKITTEEISSDELSTEELSNEADEEQIFGVSNAPKNIK